MSHVNIMVTGAGSLLGQGILRCLRMMESPKRIITADPDSFASGHWLGDMAYMLPMAGDEDYLSVLENIIRQEEVDFLFVGTDVELPKISRMRDAFADKYDVKIVISPPHVIDIANDKWATAEFLKQEGLPFPATSLATDLKATEELVERLGFPLFVKPRNGARSVGADIVQDRAALVDLCSKRNDLVVQELLPEDDGEFTAGCLVVDGVCRSVVVLRRELKLGNTSRAFSDVSGRFDAQISDVAERLGVDGPCNFQFRIREGRPVIFEINGRFSGTTPIRAMFGFNEVSALINYYVDGVDIPRVSLRPGAVLKTWSDIFIPLDQLESLDEAGKLYNPDCEEYTFMFR